MTATLYHGEPNGPSLTVLAASFEKNVKLDLQRIDLAKGERHAPPVPQAMEVALSVEGEGPVLVADGVAMADSVFLACWLDEVGYGPAIRPADPYERWRMMAWCRWVVERVAPAAAYLGGKMSSSMLASIDEDVFTLLIEKVKSVDLAERWKQARAGDFEEDKLADSRAKIVQAVARVEGELGGDWLLGGFSIADLETYAWLAGTVHLVPEAFEGAERTKAWLARVKARPSVAAALAQASVAHPEKVWAPGPEINRWG